MGFSTRGLNSAAARCKGPLAAPAPVQAPLLTPRVLIATIWQQESLNSAANAAAAGGMHVNPMTAKCAETSA